MILTGMYAVSNLFIFGGLSFFRPDIAFPDAGEAATFPIEFFAIRHFAFGFPLIHGLLKKNITILTTMYSIFLVMTVLDVAVVLIKGYYIPVIGDLPVAGTIALGLGGFIIPVVAALLTLKKLKQQQ